VYSRYGKKNFSQDDKNINPSEKIAAMYNTFNPCNLRRIIRHNECEGLFVSANHKTYEKLPDPYYTPASEEDKTLVFESRMECGNLSLAVKVSYLSITNLAF
jgi:hypothetical protein